MPYVDISEITSRRLKNEAIGRFMDDSEKLDDGRRRIEVDQEVFNGLIRIKSRNDLPDLDAAINALLNEKQNGS